MRRAIGVLSRAALVAAAALGSRPAASRAQGGGGVAGFSCLRQICLSFSLPRRVYPRNALVMGTVTVRYGGHAWIIPNGEDLNPRIEVLGGQGNVLFPPPFPPPVIDVANVIRKSAPPGPLLHDQVIRAHMPIILRGSRVRAAFDFSVQFNGHTIPMKVQTPAVRVRLVPGRAPAVVGQTAGTVSARIRPAGPEDRGPLYHDGWYACPLPGGGKWYGGSSWYEEISTSPNGPSIMIGTPYGWKPTHSRLLKPGCAQPIEWHVVAGWLGQPVVAVNYSPPSTRFMAEADEGGDALARSRRAGE